MYNKNMKKKFIRGLVCIFVFLQFLFSQESRPVLQDIDYTAVIDRKMKIEAKFENYINKILAEMLGPDKATVKIDITPNVEKSRIETETWAKQEEAGGGAAVSPPTITEFLPGIPKKQDLVQKAEEKTSAQTSGMKRNIESIIKVPESFIKKIRTVLIASQDIPDEEFQAVKELIIDILSLDFNRGDELIIRRVKFSPFRKLKKYLTNPYFYLALLLTILTLLFLLFLFSLLKTLKESKEKKSEVEAAGTGVGGGGGVLGEMEEQEKQEEEEKEEEEAEEGEGEGTEEIERKRWEEIIATLPVPEEEVGKMAFKPFKFVEDRDVRRIAYMLANEDPQVIATVIHYLDDDKAAKFLKLLPDDRRADVISAFTKVQFVDQSKIACLERVIKRRIDLTSGGVDRLLGLLEAMDEKSRNQILDQVAAINPDIADQVKNLVFTFERLASLTDRDLQTLLSEVNAPDLAVAIKGMDEEFRTRILNNLSEAARRLVEEEEEAGRAATATEAQVEEQRRLIVQKAKQMEAEGRIDLGGLKDIPIFPDELESLTAGSIMEEVEREMEKQKKLEEERRTRREKIGMIEEEEPVVDNEKAFEHYTRGADLFQEGNYEEALREFEEAIRYNPDVWQTYQYLGSTLYALGKEGEAIKAYEKSLELNPDNEELKAWIEEHKPKEEEKTEEPTEEAPVSEGAVETEQSPEGENK